MLSYHADMDINTNPYELGLDRLVNLDTEAEFVGKAALERLRASGVTRRHVGLRIDCAPSRGRTPGYGRSAPVVKRWAR
jgi:aminomethyltransferase